MAKEYNYGVVVLKVEADEYRTNEEKAHLLSAYEFSKDKKEKEVKNTFEPWTKKQVEAVLDVEVPDEDEEMGADVKPEPFKGKGAYVTLVMRGTSYVLGALNLVKNSSLINSD